MKKLVFAFLSAVDGAGICLLLEGLYAHDVRSGWGTGIIVISTLLSAMASEEI